VHGDVEIENVNRYTLTSLSALKSFLTLIKRCESTYKSRASVRNIDNARDVALYGGAAKQEVDLVVVISCDHNQHSTLEPRDRPETHRIV